MTCVTMYDDVNVSLLPANTAVAGGYIGGNWLNAGEVRHKFPRAKVINIAISASEDGDCLDVENGDAMNAQAPGWFKKREGHTLTPKPWLYTSAGDIAALVATMQRAGVARNRYYIWSAHYTYQAHICSPKACGYPVADGTQWTDKSGGKNLDQSLVNTYMLPGSTSAANKPAPVPAPAKKPAPEPNVTPIISALNTAGRKTKPHSPMWWRIHNAVLALLGRKK